MNHELLPQPSQMFTTQRYRDFLQRYYQWQDHGYPKSDRFDKQAYRVWRKEWFDWYEEYRSCLPVYLLARCPICAGRAWDSIDTYSLNGPGWWKLGSPYARFHWSDTQDNLQSDCGHAQLMSWSINLNGLTTDDLFVGVPGLPLHIDSERPRVMLWPLQVQETRTFAVIHALPIDRYDDPGSQYYYTAYFVTYFAEDVRVFREKAVQGDMSVFAFEGVAYDYDLVKWVQRGQLFWLDANEPNLPLRGDPIEAFPYAHVQGRGEEEWLEIVEGKVKEIGFHVWDYETLYRDGYGVEGTSLSNNGHSLGITLRKVWFTGTDLDQFTLKEDGVLPSIFDYDADRRILHPLSVDCNVPVTVIVDRAEVKGKLIIHIEPEKLDDKTSRYRMQLELSCGIGVFKTNGHAGWIREQMAELQESLPDGVYLRICHNCALAAYNPFRPDGFNNSLGCFRHLKGTPEARLPKGADYPGWTRHALYKQTIWVCEYFEPADATVS